MIFVYVWFKNIELNGKKVLHMEFKRSPMYELLAERKVAQLY